MSSEFNKIVDELANELLKLFGNKLIKTILYGSYARGDFEKDSDVDIMVLLDLNFDEIRKYDDDVSKITTDFCIRYGIFFSIFTKEIDVFNRYFNILPFYKNVVSEGVSLYARG